MVSFKRGQKVFSYEAMRDDKQLKKEGEKYRGQVFTARIEKFTPKKEYEIMRGIWLEAAYSITGTQYVNYINLEGAQIAPATYPLLHNAWSYISLNKEAGVKDLIIGAEKLTSSEAQDVIVFLFEEDL